MRARDLEKLGEGREAEIFAWEPGVVLRLFRDPSEGERAAREVEVLGAVRSVLDVVPAVLERLDLEGRPGLLMERLEGPSLLEQLARSPWQVSRLARLVGRVHAELHATRAPSSLPALRETLGEQLAHSEVPAPHRETARRVLERLPDGDRLCHGDFWPGNLLLTQRGPVVIDWPDATRGDPAGDYARTTLMMRVGSLPPGIPALIRITRAIGGSLFRASYQRAYASRRGGSAAPSVEWELVRAAARLAEGVPEERPALLRELERLSACLRA